MEYSHLSGVKRDQNRD